MASPRLTVVLDGNDAVLGDAAAIVPWWSVTKTVIAAACLVLVRDGLIALDEPLAGRAFTPRQLLRHRAGLADYGMLPAYHAAVAAGEAPWSRDEMLARVAAFRPDAVPEEFSYSNVGYLHLVELIEAATHETLGAALRRLVFAPLALATAGVAERPAHLLGTAWGNASGYDPAWVYHGLAVGSLGDAAQMMRGVLQGDLLPPELRAEMQAGVAVPTIILKEPWREGAYGFGLMVGVAEAGARFAGHTGQGPGSTLAVFAADGGAGRISAVAAPTDDRTAVERAAMRGALHAVPRSIPDKNAPDGDELGQA